MDCGVHAHHHAALKPSPHECQAAVRRACVLTACAACAVALGIAGCLSEGRLVRASYKAVRGGEWGALSRRDGQGVVLLEDDAEIRVEQRHAALKRVHALKLHSLKMLAHRVEDDPDVHIIKHEERTLDAIKELGSAKSLHLDLKRFRGGAGTIESDRAHFAPGGKQRAPTTVAAVARIARKAGVKISARVTASEKARAAAMIAALMKSAKTKIHKVHVSPKAVFHRKMKQAMFNYKLYQGRHGHVAAADATPQSPLAKMLGYKHTGHRGADLPLSLRESLDPKAAAAAKKADFHARMAAALLAYQRIRVCICVSVCVCLCVCLSVCVCVGV